MIIQIFSYQITTQYYIDHNSTAVELCKKCVRSHDKDLDASKTNLPSNLSFNGNVCEMCPYFNLLTSFLFWEVPKLGYKFVYRHLLALYNATPPAIYLLDCTFLNPMYKGTTLHTSWATGNARCITKLGGKFTKLISNIQVSIPTYNADQTLNSQQTSNISPYWASCIGSVWEKTDLVIMAPHHLTHLPLDKMAGISQMIFSDAFSWTK